MKRPPNQCAPLKCSAHFLGAVSEMRQSGSRRGVELSPAVGGPDSTFHPDGMSTLAMRIPLSVICLSRSKNAGRTGGLKLKPKIASTMRSKPLFASDGKS